MKIICKDFYFGFTVGSAYRITLGTKGCVVSNDRGEEVDVRELSINWAMAKSLLPKSPPQLGLA